MKNGKVENAGLMDSSYKIPGGGLVSTAEDYARFSEALMDGKIVKKETVDTMWTATGVPTMSDGKPSGYGMGFGVFTIHGEKCVAHDGGQQGASTIMEVIPGKRFAIAVLTNNENAEPVDVLRQILDLYHMPHSPPHQ